MAYITFQPSDYFNTKLHTGTGSAASITGVGFQPDFVWVKQRNGTENHVLEDSVRGATKLIQSDSSAAEQTGSQTLTSFDSDGFSVGTDAGWNGSSNSYVMWNWKAGTTSGITTNSDTSITPSAYSFNQTSGFSIIKYTGTAVDGAYLPHGLGKAPELLLLKSTSLAESWNVYSKPTGYGGRGHLNNGDAFDTSRGEWYSTNPDSVNMRISNDSHINGSGATYIAYFFTSIKGHCKIGSYTGNGVVSQSPFIYTGFKPGFILIKKTSGSEYWGIIDNKRPGYNTNNYYVYPNATSAEGTSTSLASSICANGFKPENNDTFWNTNGQTYLYMAIAAEPFVASNSDPATAR
tara:strand:+ start:1182 stop:2228 length:1047 start_codon:yes stop_codon:yes gene_type:complete